MKLLPNTLAFRLTFWYTLVVIILITIAFNASYFLLSKALDHDMEQDLIEDIGEFRTLYQKAGLAGVKQEINRDLMKSGEEERIFFFFSCLISRVSECIARISLIGHFCQIAVTGLNESFLASKLFFRPW